MSVWDYAGHQGARHDDARVALGRHARQAIPVDATFARYAIARNYREDRVALVNNVRHAVTGAPLCGHLWVNAEGPWARGLVSGQTVRFVGTVRSYLRIDGTRDWHLVDIQDDSRAAWRGVMTRGTVQGGTPDDQHSQTTGRPASSSGGAAHRSQPGGAGGGAAGGTGGASGAP